MIDQLRMIDDKNLPNNDKQVILDILTEWKRGQSNSFCFQFAYLSQKVLYFSSVIAEMLPQSQKQIQAMIEAHCRVLNETNFDAIRTTVNQSKSAAEATKLLLEEQVPDIKESILKEARGFFSQESAKAETEKKVREAEERLIEIEKQSVKLKKHGYLFASIAGVGAVCSVLFLASILFMFFYGKHVLTGEPLILGEYPLSKLEFRRLEGKLCVRVPQNNPRKPVWFYERGWEGDQERVWGKYVEVDTGENR